MCSVKTQDVCVCLGGGSGGGGAENTQCENTGKVKERTLKRIYSIRRFLTEDAAKILVTSYILSRLDYCNCILMGKPNSVIQPLQKIQNFAARVVLLSTRHQHSTPLLEKLHWLPISERIKYKVACMCFNAINGSDPAYLSALLHVYTPSRTLRSSSDTRMLKIQQYKRKNHGFRTFSCFGPHIWNSLPEDLRHCSTLSSFKAKLSALRVYRISYLGQYIM